MSRTARRQGGPVLRLVCAPCATSAGPYLGDPEAVQAAGEHDDTRHGGSPTVLALPDRSADWPGFPGDAA